MIKVYAAAGSALRLLWARGAVPPAVLVYKDRLKARPAYQRAFAVP